MSALDATLEDIARISDLDSIQGVLERVAESYGMKTVAYLGTARLHPNAPRQDPFFAVTYSKVWVDRYRARGYVNIDPAIQIGLRRLLPIDWDELRTDEGPIRDFFGEASDFGLGRKGLSIPVHGHLGDRALFSVTADMSNREWRWARRTAFRHLPIVATHVHDAMLRLEGVCPHRAHLSPRELECLQWASEGKTVWECSVILGLSPHTVRCYMESARYKLGATSNTHAVSLALQSGLLSRLP